MKYATPLQNFTPSQLTDQEKESILLQLEREWEQQEEQREWSQAVMDCRKEHQ